MRQVEWLNSNAYRRYPFVEDSSLTLSGGVEMDNSVIVDFQGVNFYYTPRPLRFTGVIISAGSPTTGQFLFTYDSGTTFSFLVPETAGIPYRATSFTSGIQHIVCVFGPGLEAFLQNPPGAYTCSTIPPQIEPALISFQNKHRVESISGTGPGSAVIDGRVWLEEAHNCQAGINYLLNTLRISAIRGAGQGVDCTRLTPDVVLCSEALLRINGLHANDAGDFVISGGDGVEVQPDPANNQIIIRRKASDIQNCG